jgi:multiple sugar transport system substrate-binding protein
VEPSKVNARPIIVSCLALIALLGGCSLSLGGQGKTIRLSGYTSSPGEIHLMQDLIKEFQQKNPEIRVSYEPIPGNYVPKILTMLVSGTAPDVFYLDSLYFPSFLSKGVLLPLDDYMASSSVSAADFFPTLVRAFSDGGKIYGIPKDFNALALYYNMDIFCEEMRSYPNDVWTWDDLEATALKFTKMVSGTKRYGICLPGDDATRWLPFAFANGADIFNVERTRCIIASSEAVGALSFYSSFEMKSHSSVPPSALGSPSATDAFAKQKAAMVIEGGWLAAYLKEQYPKVRFGIAELPRTPSVVKGAAGLGTGGRSNLLFTVAYAIPKTSRNAAAAWRLIDYLTRPEQQLRITYALPSRVSVKDEYLKRFSEYGAIFNAAQYGKPDQFGKRGARVIEILGHCTQRVFLAGDSPTKALNAAQDELNSLLEIK